MRSLDGRQVQGSCGMLVAMLQKLRHSPCGHHEARGFHEESEKVIGLDPTVESKNTVILIRKPYAFVSSTHNVLLRAAMTHF